MSKIKAIDAGQEHSDGLQVGVAAAEKLAFHGAAPIIQAASALTSAQIGGAPSQANYNALQLDFTTLRTALINKGLITGP